MPDVFRPSSSQDQSPENSQKKEWFEKSGIMILWLIFFWPVFLYGLNKYYIKNKEKVHQSLKKLFTCVENYNYRKILTNKKIKIVGILIGALILINITGNIIATLIKLHDVNKNYDSIVKAININEWEIARTLSKNFPNDDKRYGDVKIFRAIADSGIVDIQIKIAEEYIKQKKWDSAKIVLDDVPNIPLHYHKMAIEYSEKIDHIRWLERYDSIYKIADSLSLIEKWEEAVNIVKGFPENHPLYKKTEELVASALDYACNKAYVAAIQLVNEKKWDQAKNVLSSIPEYHELYIKTKSMREKIDSEILLVTFEENYYKAVSEYENENYSEVLTLLEVLPTKHKLIGSAIKLKTKANFNLKKIKEETKAYYNRHEASKMIEQFLKNLGFNGVWVTVDGEKNEKLEISHPAIDEEAANAWSDLQKDICCDIGFKEIRIGNSTNEWLILCK